MTAARVLLEQLGLATITDSDHPGTLPLRTLPPLIDQANKIISSLKLNPSYAHQVWFVRCQALLEFIQGNFAPSRRLWLQIRSAVAEKKDEQEKYLWWESRYFSLRCLIRMQRAD